MISNELAESTRTVVAILSIPNKDFRLRPGMFVRVRIVLSEHKDTQAVPPNAVITKDDVRGIFTIDRNTQTAQFIPVQTGLETRSRVEILSPELTGPVVTVGNHMLENGKQVEISQLSRLHMAESLAAEASKNAEQAQPAAGQDSKPEQQPAADQPQAVPTASGDKAQ